MKKGKKRVLFLERNLRNEKLGVMYLAGALAGRGHEADLIQTDKEDVDARIRDFKPDFVAFSITTGEHIYAIQMARYVKEKFGIPNIFGGPHCTFFPEVGYEPAIDYTVQGQGEQAILDIVEGRVEPGFHKAEMAVHLDNLPDPDRNIFYKYPEFRDNPMKNVITSRACPYKCSYCFNHSQLALTKIDGETKRWFDRRSIEHVVDEINRIRDKYALEKILFIDDSFIQSKSWLDAFLDGYTEHVRLPWLCSLRVNCLDEDLAKRMFESRLEMVNYAIESADPDVQQRLLHRGHITNHDVIRAIRLFDQYGVRARMQNMIGLPLANTLEDALNTLQFNMRHRVTDAWCSIFQPYPRTALGQYCVDHGFIEADQLKHCSESFFDESRLSIPHKKELYALQKLWYFVIEGNLSLDLVQLLIKGSYSAELADSLQRLRFRCSRKNLYGIDDADPEVAIDLQSRERWGYRKETGLTASPAEQEDMMKAILKDCTLPDRFVDIMANVGFDDATRAALDRFARGTYQGEPIVYTIDDETGELADPEQSILTRGVSDPVNKDIRNMPESHFMQGMAEVRDDLKVMAGRGTDDRNTHDAASIESASPAGSTKPADATNTVDSTGRINATDSNDTEDCADHSDPNGIKRDKDERHLNHYLA